MSDWDLEDAMLHALMVCCVAMVAAMALGLCASGVDQLIAVRAERKAIACAVQRMDSRRVRFTTEVTCVPMSRDTRNDTLTIRAEARND